MAFMAALRPLTSGQVSYSEHTDSSDLEIHTSDMINHSDQHLQTLLVEMWRDPHGYHNDNSVSQNDINRQILAQFSNLGDNLAAIESSTARKPNKKTSEVEKEIIFLKEWAV